MNRRADNLAAQSAKGKVGQLFAERVEENSQFLTNQILHDVLEATGYLSDGRPEHGVCLGEETDGRHRAGDFSPDAVWRSESALAVYFKYEQEVPSDEQVAGWHREIWNQGFAPLLWVISPEKISIYNGFSRPRDAGDAAEHLLDTFNRVESELNRLDAFAGRLAMETGQFWSQAHDVDRRNCVDRQLLSDLGALERGLVSADLESSSAQELIGRSIFTQYLIDREIVTHEFLEREYGQGTLSAILRDREATKRLFDWLRETFNGDMFLPRGSFVPRAEHLRRVADFLDAVDPVSKQMTFFPYQFDVIPVELISSIYEQFVHANSGAAKTESETDVYYTRLSLVSLVLDEITEGLTGAETVLDLSCGSGVFLVEGLRRLVALRSGAGEPSREIIRSTLHRQIHGVDISETAIRIAAFSLYLAALELDPDPQPPQALRFRPLIGETLIIGDAWDVKGTPEGRTALIERGNRKTFDLIVGNPPWSYPGKLARIARRSKQDPQTVCSPRGVSLDFVSRAMEFSHEGTRFGLVLSAVQFFSRSGTGISVLRQLIEKLSPVTLVNLSFQTGWLFSRGNLPAMVLFARHRPTDRAEITTVQVPWSPANAQSHTFEIARDDIVSLPLADWRRKPELLKAAFYGLRRDLALVDKLTSGHASLGEQLDAFCTKLRSGLAVGDRSRDSSFLHGFPLLNKVDAQPFVVPNSLASYNADGAERPRSVEIYRAPLLVVREFLGDDGRAVVAVSSRDLVFTNAFFGAALPVARLEAAHLLAAILSSSLASWFFLMTASSFGLSMRRVTLRDLEHLPIPDLESAWRSKAARRITQLVQGPRRIPLSGHDWQAIDEAVFDLYALDDAERIVARDGLFRAGWQWRSGRIQSAAPTDTDPHILAYTDTFLTAMDAWLAVAKRRRMRGEVFDFPTHAPLRVVRFVLEEGVGPSTRRVILPEGDLRAVLDRTGERLNFQIATSLVGQRALRVYGPDEVVIIKPAARRHWMGVSALEDADAVAAESFTGIVA